MDTKKDWSNPPWNLKDALIALGLVFVINNSVGFLVKNLNLSWSRLSYFAFASTLQTLGIVLVVLYFVFAKRHGSSKSLGLQIERLGKYLLTGIGGGILVFLAVVASGLVVERYLPISGELQPFAQLVVSVKTWPQLILLFFLGVILAPLGEELYFRGFLYPALRSHLGIPLAVLVSASIFGILHLDILRFLPLTVGGIVLALLYEKTGSLYTTMAAHGFWNFVMLVLLVVSKGNLG